MTFYCKTITYKRSSSVKAEDWKHILFQRYFFSLWNCRIADGRWKKDVKFMSKKMDWSILESKQCFWRHLIIVFIRKISLNEMLLSFSYHERMLPNFVVTHSLFLTIKLQCFLHMNAMVSTMKHNSKSINIMHQRVNKFERIGSRLNRSQMLLKSFYIKALSD